MYLRFALAILFALPALTACAQESKATKAEDNPSATPIKTATTKVETTKSEIAKPPVKPEPTEGPAEQTQKALFAFAEAFAEAFNKHDAKALAALWASNGVHVDRETGERVVGRDAIEKVYTDLFSDDESKQIVVTIDNVRLITPDVATADGAASVVSEAEEDPSESTFAAVFVKNNGAWLLDSAQETNLPATEKPYDHLQALDWMVGEWQDESEDVEVHTTCNWAANYSFLKRSYSVARDGEVTHQGTQVIGWDPESETIRSWNFESDGGFGEGVWTQDGDKWTVKLSAVTPGARAAATQVIIIVDDNTVKSQMVGREVDGEMLPSTDPVTVVRVVAPTE